jgi:exopolysaccharide production protein ExoZ
MATVIDIKRRSPSTTRRTSLRTRLASLYETDMSSGRVLPMEGLRGLAILLVFLCHYKIVVLERLSPTFNSVFFEVVVQMGATGVDLFFLLSGMLIYRAALRRGLHLGKFMARRVRRIYPTFLVAFAIYLCTSVLLHQGPQRVPHALGAAVRYVVLNLLLLPGVADMESLIPAAWSLSYEFCFYIAIPIVVIALRMSLWSRRRRCVFWSSLLTLHIIYVLALPHTLPVYTYQDATFLRFGMFLFGMLCYELLNSLRATQWLTVRRQLWFSALGSAAAIAYGWLVFRNANLVDVPVFYSVVRAVLVPLIYTSLTLATLGENGIWGRLFSNTYLRWTGNISYSMYLIHGIVLNALIAVLLHLSVVRLHPHVSAAILLPISFATTFVAATLLFVGVEKPFSLQPSKTQPPAVAHTSSSVA